MRRSTTWRRLSSRAMGPSCAALTVKHRAMDASPVCSVQLPRLRHPVQVDAFPTRVMWLDRKEAIRTEGEASMSERLAGKVCLVTAAAQGIGRATALAFAAEGA